VIKRPVEIRKEGIALPDQVVSRIQRSVEKRDAETP